MLRGWGYAGLAERLAYLASDADLEEGDAPATLASARGFLAFFGAVASAEGKLGLACSWEGWICAEWRFNDCRMVSLLFSDRDKVDCAARKSDGHFININCGSEVDNLSFVTAKLVESKEWFTWFKTAQMPAKTANINSNTAPNAPFTPHQPPTSLHKLAEMRGNERDFPKIPPDGVTYGHVLH